MAEMTLEQQRALAVANARKRQAEAAGSVSAKPNIEEGKNVDFLANARDLAKKVTDRTQNGDVVEDLKGVGTNLDTMVRGVADTLSFGLADEIAAGGDALTTGDDYGKRLSLQRARDKQDAAERPGTRLTGQLLGGVTQGAGLIKAGLSPTATAIQAGKSLPKIAGYGAAEGGTLAAAQGFGSGEGIDDRIRKAWQSGLVGSAIGGGLPVVTSAAQKIATPVMAYLDPTRAKDRIMAALMDRAGTNADDVAAKLQAAQADGQDMFTAADALELPGRRILSTAARTPTDARKSIVDALTDRQTDQGRRLSGYLAEGFNARDTAAQRKLALEGERKLLADVNYPNASATASAVDVGGAIRQIDDVLKPGVQKIVDPGSGLADDSTDALLTKFRAQMTNGREQLTDFDEVLKLKSEIGDRAKALAKTGEKYKASQLAEVAKRLDSALEKASPDYRAANDAFRAQSKTIDAIETGADATSRRARFSDTVNEFESLQPGEQMAFRSGYSDPLIASIEGNPGGVMTNRARPLLSPKMKEEFDVFAIPGRKDKMVRRIDREQQMFETANAALGGSKTADNLADMADSGIDPGVIAALVQGRFKDAALSALTQSANAARGLPPSVIEKLAPALMETNPQLAKELFSKSAQTKQLSDATRAKLISALMSTSSTVPGRALP